MGFYEIAIQFCGNAKQNLDCIAVTAIQNLKSIFSLGRVSDMFGCQCLWSPCKTKTFERVECCRPIKSRWESAFLMKIGYKRTDINTGFAVTVITKYLKKILVVLEKSWKSP